jgi:hypothetical protein
LGLIDRRQLQALAEALRKNGYGQYLLEVLREEAAPREGLAPGAERE